MNAINATFITANNLEFERGDLRIRVGGLYGEETRRAYLNVPVTLWGTETPFRNQIDLELRNKDMQMVLGAGFLANFIFQFDYLNKRMRAFAPSAVDMKKIENLETKRDPVGGSSMVRVKLDGRKLWLTLNTGNPSGINVDRSIAVKEKWLEKYQIKKVAGYSVVSSGEGVSFNLDTLELGSFEIGNPIVSVPPEGKKWNLFRRSSNTRSRVPRMRGKSSGC